jgi:hypothetical protein
VPRVAGQHRVTRLLIEVFWRKGKRQPWLRVSAGRMQDAAMGRLPDGVADGDPGAPAPEYVAEATTPSDDVWAREQAHYREKNEPHQTDG